MGFEDDTDELASSLQAAEEQRPRRDAGAVDAMASDGALASDGHIADAFIPADASTADASPGSDGGRPPPLDGGFPSDGGLPTFGPVAQIRFDDCSASSPVLGDSSGFGMNATRSNSVQCVAGLLGQAVNIDERRDTVEVPAHPRLAIGGAFTVAAWVRPRAAQGMIVSKQTAGGSAFELFLERNRVTFAVNVNDGRRARRVLSSAPITLDRWTHVAGVFDGQFVRLFRDGAQVGQVAAAGVVADVNAPVRIGNSASSQAFAGAIDEVVMFVRSLEEFEIRELSCVSAPPTMTVTPTSATADPEQTVSYDVAVRNNSVGACADSEFFLFSRDPPNGIEVRSDNFQVINPGQTGHFTLQVTGTFDAEFTTHVIGFEVFDNRGFESVPGEVEFTLREPTGCFVRTERELIMLDLSVVDDPVRTTFNGSAEDPRTGAWTFARLMEQMAPTASQAPRMVEDVFRSLTTDQTINTFSIPARRDAERIVLSTWPRTANGELDLRRAPVTLLAIVNRIDVRNLDQGHAGEGRFVFSINGAGGFPLQATLILEYVLPASTNEDVLAWANAWHALGQLPFPSEEYNAALQALTDRFAGRGVAPSRPNGSALGQLRTNEISLGAGEEWELREFKLSAQTGMLVPVPVALTPDNRFMTDTGIVADYINQNEASILIERHDVPLTFQGRPFLGGSSFNPLAAWRIPGVNNPEARFRFSLNTCNGCHASEETQTPFLMINPRFPGQRSRLAGFMTGVTVPDPMTGIPRTLDDLERRNDDLKALVCGGVASTLTAPLPASAPSPARRPASRDQFVRRGIGRVH